MSSESGIVDPGLTLKGDVDLLDLALEKVKFFGEMEVPCEEELLIYGDKYILHCENGKITLRAEFNLPEKHIHKYITTLAKELREIQGKNR